MQDKQQVVVLGDEAVALGAVHAGVSLAYAYPGTPSTEIMEYLVRYSKSHPQQLKAYWTANEKTAYEEVLGASFAGLRSITSMKHVGLNVAADPFVNSAIVEINGGVLLAVADDPGMHSSQNEQDSRFYADFAKVLCFEPSDQQQCYDMSYEAFEVSEKFKIPVMIRLVTRLAHSRSIITTKSQLPQKTPHKPQQAFEGWTLLPQNARRLWQKLVETQKNLLEYSQNSLYNELYINPDYQEFGVITTGIAKNYYLENISFLHTRPSHLHIGVYPIPLNKVQKLCSHAKKILVIEEGYPFVERYLRGLLNNTPITICGKEDGTLPYCGELTPDVVRQALGINETNSKSYTLNINLPPRPPQLCTGCPHADAFNLLNEALKNYPQSVVTSDIGCYTLGALPPYESIETCVCMGASVSMAKGAADAGLHPVVAVIGDSTFLHSGVTPLMDAVSSNANMTLMILDNGTIAMTGTQPTVLSSEAIYRLVLALGVKEDHVHVLEAKKGLKDKNLSILMSELEYKGISVIIMQRECLELIKSKKKG